MYTQEQVDELIKAMKMVAMGYLYKEELLSSDLTRLIDEEYRDWKKQKGVDDE